jgi:cytochrome oxidase Cu insertion factor (SCO1/SenC/PrrC family)
MAKHVRREEMTILGLTATIPAMISKRLAETFAAYSLMLLAVAAFAAAPASPEKTGLAVGQKAPDFTLKDQNDRDVSLASLVQKGPVAVVFFRSADW